MGAETDVPSRQDSWKKALKIYDSRISGLSAGEGVRLRRWGAIVAEAYADLEKRIPGFEPPVLTSLALLEDGRAEGSKYPNLMVPAARVYYGI